MKRKRIFFFKATTKPFRADVVPRAKRAPGGHAVPSGVGGGAALCAQHRGLERRLRSDPISKPQASRVRGGGDWAPPTGDSSSLAGPSEHYLGG